MSPGSLCCCVFKKVTYSLTDWVSDKVTYWAVGWTAKKSTRRLPHLYCLSQELCIGHILLSIQPSQYLLLLPRHKVSHILQPYWEVLLTAPCSMSTLHTAPRSNVYTAHCTLLKCAHCTLIKSVHRSSCTLLTIFIQTLPSAFATETRMFGDLGMFWHMMIVALRICVCLIFICCAKCMSWCV